MIIVEKDEGPKIPYSVRTTKVTFDDDLTINLAKREQDWPVHIDICTDTDGELVIGAAVGRMYVAEIDIPARRYEIVPIDNDESQGEEPSQEEPSEGDEPFPPEPSEERIPIPLDMNLVTLSLWAIEEA